MSLAFPIRIGSRKSPLAVRQAEIVVSALQKAHNLSPQHFIIETLQTSGDRLLNRKLEEFGGKGLFTKELEQALLDGKIDVAVHSAKDMPTLNQDGLTIAGFLAREDIRDAWLSPKYKSTAALPEGARVGTASLRRQALLLRERPDLRIVLFRGNIQTRLEKLKRNEVEATLLAYAGLKRMGLETVADTILSIEAFPPALGQGAIGLEVREQHSELIAFLSPLNDENTALALNTERTLLRLLDGSCRTPIAGHAIISNGIIELSAHVLSPDGKLCFHHKTIAPISDANNLAESLAEDLLKDMGENFWQRFK